MIDPTQIINDTQCAICQASPSDDAPNQRYFQFQGRKLFLCEQHAQAFHAGALMGQMELNARLAEHIAGVDESVTMPQLKEQVFNMVPLARRQVMEREKLLHYTHESYDRSPRDICEHLNRNVVGQEEAKRRISLAVYEHYRSMQRPTGSPLLEKQNILMLGPSGSGKTLIANTVAQVLNLPFVATDATGYSPTGFQGADVDTMIHDLMFRASGVAYTAERGVVFVDEIDKLSTHNLQGSKAEALNYATQSSLLKLIEGKKVKVPMQTMGEPQGTISVVDTTRMLFMFGGAFTGLAEQVGKLMGYTGRTISLTRRDQEDKMEASIRSYEILAEAPTDVITKALIDYGMNTELIGRIPIIVPLAPLTVDQLHTCLIDMPHSPVPRAQTLFAESGILLEFEDALLSEVVTMTTKTDTGTRALHSLIKRAINQASFDLLGGDMRGKTQHVVITKECLSNPAAYQVSR